MPRLHCILLTVLVLLSAGGPAAAQDAYVNPVIDQLGVADPFLLKWNGEYYLYASGDPIRAFHSTDMVHWEELDPVLSSSDAPEAWNQADVWAPEVVYRNGTFYMYYTASRASDDWRVGEMARRIGVAVSESPRGPFVDAGDPVTPGWGIDGHVFQDPDDGQEYLFYSYLYEPRLPGAGIVADRMLAWDEVAGEPSHVTRGSEAWEDKDGDPNNGSLRYTNEAPTVLKRHGRYYMMYSGGSWDRPTYALAYAISDEVIPVEGLEGPGWNKVVPPILRTTRLVEAPGHNSVVKAPNNVDDVTAYHARTIPFAGPGDRQTFIDRLYWNQHRMFMEQPSLGLQPAPDRPLFSDRFAQAGDALGDGWSVAAGRWRVEDGAALASSGLALAQADPFHHYVFEANIRFAEGASKGAAGVAAYYAGEDDHVDVWLDRARRALITSGTLGGQPLPEAVTPLPSGFRFDAYHQVLVTKNAGRLLVELDGVTLQEHELSLGTGRAGLRVRGASTRFDGVALTPFFDDTFEEPDVTWTRRGGAWLVDEGALRQGAGGADRYIALKGDPASDYEFMASVRFRNQESTSSTAGIVAAATEEDEMVLAGFDRTIWPFARFWVRRVAGGEVRETISVGLPRGFLYDEYHTIRAVKQDDAFTFYLDGEEVVAARFPIGSAQPGLYTEGARAAFDNARMKRIVVPRNLMLDGSFEARTWEDVARSPEAPWQITGAAMINDCCAYDGTKRLLITGDGRATQVVRGLEPGHYTLHAWVLSRDAEAAVRVAPAGGTAREAAAAGEAWRHVVVDFDVPPGRSAATITLGGQLSGEDSYVAVDNVFLTRQ